MNLNLLNQKCSRTIFLYQNRNSNSFSINMRKELLKNIMEINDTINKNTIDECYEDFNKNYNILLYIILFREDLVSHKIILDVLNNSLSGKTLFASIIDLILTMKKELNDEIISKILLLKNKSHLQKPYDWRFHILKRNEISNDLKKQILETYTELELKKIVDEIYSNLKEEYADNEGKTLEELKEFKNILEEQRAYDILKQYQEELEIKKSK